MVALQKFLGYCKEPPPRKDQVGNSLSPPALFKYTRSLELSLSPDFALEIPCVRERLYPHLSYDFHWLHLDRFQNLSSIKIWLVSQAVAVRVVAADEECVPFVYLELDALKRALRSFGGIKSVYLSAPLPEIPLGTEEGYLEDFPDGTHVWRRGNGDRFHYHHYDFGAGFDFEGG